MKISVYRPSEHGDISGHFYCAFDPNTRQIQLAIEAASEEEAQHRIARVAHLIGIQKPEKFCFVVLEKAPSGVPAFLKD